MSIKEYHMFEHLLQSSFDLKRVFDICLSMLLLILFSPLMLLIAALIKATSKGSIFYGGTRLGLHGKPFSCWKFRTMSPHAESILDRHLQTTPRALQEWNTYKKLKKDPRITFVGRLLRKTSLDELPQLWNALRGDLSLVGPRPYLPEEVGELLKEKAPTILSVRPGMTGLWQVSGRSNLPFQERIRLDQEYIRLQSWRFDFLLLCKTIPVVLFLREHG